MEEVLLGAARMLIALQRNVTQAFQPVFEPVHRLESLCHFPDLVRRFVFLIE
jgi:hypothetical protein